MQGRQAGTGGRWRQQRRRLTVSPSSVHHVKDVPSGAPTAPDRSPVDGIHWMRLAGRAHAALWFTQSA